MTQGLPTERIPYGNGAFIVYTPTVGMDEEANGAFERLLGDEPENVTGAQRTRYYVYSRFIAFTRSEGDTGVNLPTPDAPVDELHKGRAVYTELPRWVMTEYDKAIAKLEGDT